MIELGLIYSVHKTRIFPGSCGFFLLTVDPSFDAGERAPVLTLLGSRPGEAGRVRWDWLCCVKW